MQLRDFLALTDEQFRALFRGSPIKRIKRRGFLRNVFVALENVGTADNLPALERAAANPEPLIAKHAAWASAKSPNGSPNLPPKTNKCPVPSLTPSRRMR